MDDGKQREASLHPFCQGIDAAWATTEWRHLHVLLAVSGGADSVALLRAMVQLKQVGGGPGRLYVAHFHHGLRCDADRDEQWVAALCRSLGLPLEIGRADQDLTIAADGVEAAARKARYRYLSTTAQRLGARFLVTAHTADDQAETVLYHVLRGTGLRGLAGMRDWRPLSESVSLVRPLLGIWRSEVINYLDHLHQQFCTDSTNTDMSYTRNRLRIDLLPKLRSEYNLETDRALVRLALQAREAHDFLSDVVNRLFDDCVESTEAGRRIAIQGKTLLNYPEIVVRELCQRAWASANWPEQSMGFDQWRLMAKMLRPDCPPTKVVLPGSVRAESADALLTLSRAE